MTEVSYELTGQPVSQGIRIYVNATTDAFCTDLVFPNGVSTNGVVSLIVGDFSSSYSPECCEYPDAARKLLQQRLVVSCPRLAGKPTCVPVPSSCASSKSTDNGAAEPHALPDDLMRSLWKEPKSTDDRLTISASHLTLLPGVITECNDNDEDAVPDMGFDYECTISPAPSVCSDSVPAEKPPSPSCLDASVPGFDFTTSESSEDESPLVQALKRHYAQKALAGSSSAAQSSGRPGRFKVSEDVDVDEFMCGMCDKRFPTRLRCERHVWGHLPTEDEAVKCTFCGGMLSGELALQRHHKLQHSQGQHACEQCDALFKTSGAVAVHARRTHHVCIKVHVCEYCLAMFHWRSKYDSHVLSAHSDDQETVAGLARTPEAKLRCTHCPDFVTPSDLELSRHIRALHSESGTFQCKMCSLVFQDEPGREEHENTVHVVEIERRKPRTVYLCRICNKGITTLPQLAKHLRLHLHLGPREKRFLCTTCGLQLSSPDSLRIHMMLHEDRPPLQCPHCPMRLQNKIYLNKHIKRKHTAQLRYSCTHCGKKFSSDAELPRHLARVHLDAALSPKEAAMVAKLRRHACHLCPFEAFTKVRLAKHMASHPEARWLQCRHCKICYPTDAELQAHLARAHKSAPCKRPCPFCRRVFFSNTSYDAHLELHTQGTGMVCPLCDQVFGTTTELGRHAERHDASLHQQCDDCGRKFPSVQSLQVHQRSVHEKRMVKPRQSSSVQISKNGQEYKCPLCQHHFVYPSSLQAHMVYKHDHADCPAGAKLPCPNCGHVCGSETAMAQHLRVHMGELSNTCSQCSRQFITFEAARVHSECHTTSHSFQCGECAKQFLGPSELNEDIRVVHSMPSMEDLSVASDTGHVEVAAIETAGEILNSLACAASSSTHGPHLVNH